MDDSIIFSLFSCEHLYTPFNCYCIYCKKLTYPKNTCLKCGKYRLVDDYEIIKEFEWNEYSKRSFHIETIMKINIFVQIVLCLGLVGRIRMMRKRNFALIQNINSKNENDFKVN